MVDHQVRIVGFSGHGRELLQCLRRSGHDVSVVHDRVEPLEELLRSHGVQWGGPLPPAGTPAYIGIGDGSLRRTLDAQVTSCPAVVDPGALVGESVRLGAGSVVFAQATVTVDIELGRHVHIGRGAAVGHDCRLDDYVTVMPLAAVSGSVVIGAGTTIGTGAAVRQGVTIGSHCMIGMGAVVLEDVPAGTTVVGNPARPLVR
jgi:sugar O-acyltransferase (sialic acid O-acetyltransferase NeuD family)